MIPDKIYIPQNISRSDVTSLSFLDDKGRGIEFIRKEALLEWINKARSIPHENAITRDLAFQEVVNKLNEM